MADDKLKIVATVEDQFTGPLSKLQKSLKQVGDETAKHGATWKKDWGVAREEISKVRGVLGGFEPILSKIGFGGFGAALSVAGVVTALKGFSGSTRDLSQMARQIGLTANELRTLSELGGKAGVSAETMKGAINQFAGNMVDLRQRWGQAYGELKNMNLGKLAEDLVNAPNMEAAIERAMEGLRGVPDPQKRARVSMLLFGTPDIGIVASSLNGPIREAVAKLQAELGTLDKSILEAAERFEQNLNRMHNRWENLKLKTLGPLLEGADKVLEGAEQERKAAPARERQDQIRRQLDVLDESIARKRMNGDEAGAAETQKKRDALAAEMQRLTDEIRKLREQPGGASVSPSSFGGSTGGGGSLIQKAAWGGFGSTGAGSAIPAYGSPTGGSGGGSGGGVSGGSGGGARDVPAAPDLGEGIRGRPFGSRGAIDSRGGGKKGPVGIPYEANDLKGAVGINDAQWSAYREGLTDIEGKRYEQVGGSGGRFSGRYQFGPREIAQTARQLGEAPPTRAQFLGDKAMQERFMERYTLEHHKFLESNSAAYRGMSPEKKLEILGYAHNQGAGRGQGRIVGALGYLESGRVGRDGFGTAGTRYFGTIRKRLAEIQGFGKGAGAVASVGPLAGSSGPLSSEPEAPEAEGAPDPTDGRGVNADLIKVLKRAQQLSKVKFHIHEGLRTLERQREMVRRGWSKTMDSEHLKGRAVDVRADGDPAVGDLDRKKYEEINRAMRQASEEAGIPVEWGGDWKKFKDVPHFQFPKGYRAGPNAYAGDPPAGKARADDSPVGKPTGPGGSKNGTLHIKVDGPPGTQVKADMSDLFGDTTVSHGKSQMSMAQA